MITIHYFAADGFAKTASFSELSDARNYVQLWAGKNCDVVGNDAVTFDGVARLSVEGASLADLLEITDDL
jgi:hypothetical protein